MGSDNKYSNKGGKEIRNGGSSKIKQLYPVGLRETKIKKEVTKLIHKNFRLICNRSGLGQRGVGFMSTA